MRGQIGGLLDYSRLDSSGLEYSRVDLVSVGGDVVAILESDITARDATIEIHPMPEVLGDEDQLFRVVQNLVENGLRYARDGVPPEIEMSGSAEAQWLVVSVRDNGIGIDPRFHDRVFQLFQRLHTPDDRPGTGIGLSISRKIVERHGGRIWVESAGDGQGSTFRFTLPLA